MMLVQKQMKTEKMPRLKNEYFKKCCYREKLHLISSPVNLVLLLKEKFTITLLNVILLN